MVSGLPEWLLTELNAIEDVKLRNRLAAGLQIAIYETVRDLLDKLSAVRHLMLYFNTYADWDTVLDSIRDMMRADAVQVVPVPGRQYAHIPSASPRADHRG